MTVTSDFHTRHDWRTLAIALTIWTGHFIVAWLASIIFPDQPIARWIAAALTVLCLAALYLLWSRKARPPLRSVAGLGIALSAVGVAYGTLPAVIG
ncbi:hypothetical protein A9D14_07040 [Croceicoccus marinus]|uniref:Uncharacterized protein n=1 Tax=Croceicoccus marinus TaxID=450378 RepID=A0A1Z1FAZ1_9SPHN|nr:hypothetical protein A9D14_07040 [Croceicoccus marinus]